MWSLEAELIRLAATGSLEAAIFQFGLVKSPDSSFEIEEIADWGRRGAETYDYRFKVRTEQGEHPLILKACATFSPSLSIDWTLNCWLARRQLLASHGVPVPRLLATGNGLVLEEYIPVALADALASGSHAVDQLELALARYVGALASLGFLPVDAFSDLRTRGGDIVPVDFGEDLGESGVGVWSHAGDDLIRHLLKVRQGTISPARELILRDHVIAPACVAR